MKKISIIGTVGLPAKYGGFETLTEYLCKHLGHTYDITVFCSKKNYNYHPSTYNNIKLRFLNLNANGIQSILYDILSIVHSLKFADTLLILGVSGCIVLPFVKLTSSKKIIVNIDGLEWKRDKWNKLAKWFLKFSEKMAVRYADIIVSDNKVIQNYVKKVYGKDSQLIAYGADHVSTFPLTTEILKVYPFLSSPYAFKVCRIEPENNIHLILAAFAEYTDINLVIIGNWSRSTYGQDLRTTYGNYPHIHLLDPIYDQNILNQIRSNCTIYLHGHSAGGTNPSLVEAMYLGLPILAFDVSYNKYTTHNKARYFKTPEALIEILQNLTQDQLKRMANDMKEIALSIYTWDKISTEYSKLF